MSSLTIDARPGIDPSVPMSQGNNVDKGKEFWFDRVVKNGIETFSSATVRIVCSRILGALALVAAGVVAGLAAFSIIALPFAVVAIPAVILAGLAFWHSTQIDDSKDSDMLLQLKKEAEGQSLDKVVARHGFDKIFSDQILSPSQFASQYRGQVRSMRSIRDVVNYHEKVLRHVDLHNQQRSRSPSFATYFIPHPREEAQKWHREVREKTFQEILEQYPLDKFETLGIIGHDEMQKIRELQNTYQIAQRHFQRYADEAQGIYDAATVAERAQFNAALAALERGKNENPFIQELNGLANQQLRSELRIQNEFGEQLRQVRNQHEVAIARFTVGGRPLIRETLSPENQVEYDRLAQGVFENEQRIRQQMHIRLTADRAHFTQRRPYLEGRRVEIEAQLEHDKQAAQVAFEGLEAVRNAEAAKEAAIGPHRAQFNNIQVNLTAQYRTYIGQLNR